MEKRYDKVIIGAGIYGMYAAVKCGHMGESVLVLEYENEPFQRATYVNQARVHMGYHYPRSLATAIKSAHYYHRFHEDFGFAIHGNFKQIYATSSAFSWTNASAFSKFCDAAGIKCEEISPSKYFNPMTCDGAFLTEEDTYDAQMIRDYYMNEIRESSNVDIVFNVRIKKILKNESEVQISYEVDKEQMAVVSRFLLNSTYASINQILKIIEDISEDTNSYYECYKIKYELCEIILCSVNNAMENIGLTVMDGPFFSVMPFGKTQYHSLTAVSFTPHATCYGELPDFSCQDGKYCSRKQLGNCNSCPNRPSSAWEHMSRLAKQYIKPHYVFNYEKSLFSMKPILKISEIDDSRPTSIVINSDTPRIISVLSGKINTIYDLDEYLES